jgi:hypothetical protein
MAVLLEVDDIVQAVLRGHWNAEVETNNVFNFQVNALGVPTAGDATCRNLGSGFWQAIKAALLIVTSASQVYEQIDVSRLDASGNIISGESFFIESGDGVGGQSGDALPPSDAWTFKYIRPNSSFRHGFKRFPGVPESAQSGGRPAGGAVASLAALGVLLSGPFEYYKDVAGTETAAGGEFVPAVIQRMLNGDLVDPVVTYTIDTVVFDKIGHQDTRDIGRGV